jgi:hypothetical protein
MDLGLRAAALRPRPTRRIASMLSNFADLFRNRAGRGLSPTTCAALYALFVATLSAWTVLVVGRWGSPFRWPLLQRAGLVTVSVAGSMSWWWVNGSVEGRRVLALTPNHGLTTGDLLVVPAMAFAAGLVAIEAAPRLRRAIL